MHALILQTRERALSCIALNLLSLEYRSAREKPFGNQLLAVSFYRIEIQASSKKAQRSRRQVVVKLIFEIYFRTRQAAEHQGRPQRGTSSLLPIWLVVCETRFNRQSRPRGRVCSSPRAENSHTGRRAATLSCPRRLSNETSVVGGAHSRPKFLAPLCELLASLYARAWRPRRLPTKHRTRCASA